MKLLLDTCVWGGAKRDLEAAGYDVIWVGDFQQDPGDDQILAMAFRDRRVLITLDKDFGELAIVHQREHAGIMRLVGIPSRQQASVCVQALSHYGDELLQGAIATVESTRVRIRPPDPPANSTSTKPR